MMEVVVTTGAISHAKLQSNHHHQQTQCFTGRMPLLSLNQQCQSTEGKYITFEPFYCCFISRIGGGSGLDSRFMIAMLLI